MHPDEHDFNEVDENGYAGPSRSQLRRDALDVLKLAGTLADLTDAQLAALPLSEDLLEEVKDTRSVTQQIARKRQTQFLAKQLRKLDDDEILAIRASLEHDKEFGRRETALLHRVESWRTRLIDEGDAAVNEFVAEYAQADRKQLRQLARQAKLERTQNKPLHAYREMFRLLRELTAEAPA